MKRKDHSGEKFGKLNLIKFTRMKYKSEQFYLCRCDCGKEVERQFSSMKKGITRHCGCENRSNLIGAKFNRLTAIKKIEEKNKTMYVFKCDCGNKIIREGTRVKSGHIKSCGCLSKEPSNFSHKETKTQFYKKWCGIKRRCLNPNEKAYKNYGGRGIRMQDDWIEDYENFKRDMFDSYLTHKEEYGEKNTTIERIDVNGDYCKENCKWATWKEQHQNTRKNIEFYGIDHNLNIYKSKYQRGFADRFNLDYKNINACLKKEKDSHLGWEFNYNIEDMMLFTMFKNDKIIEKDKPYVYYKKNYKFKKHTILKYSNITNISDKGFYFIPNSIINRGDIVETIIKL